MTDIIENQKRVFLVKNDRGIIDADAVPYFTGSLKVLDGGAHVAGMEHTVIQLPIEITDISAMYTAAKQSQLKRETSASWSVKLDVQFITNAISGYDTPCLFAASALTCKTSNGVIDRLEMQGIVFTNPHIDNIFREYTEYRRKTTVQDT